MAETCENCGAELFTGQRFCRACGRSIDSSSSEDAPTQRMPPLPDMIGQRGAADTAPASKQHTNPVYAPPGLYQPTVPPLPPQRIPQYTPPRSRGPLIPILILVFVIIFGVAVAGIVFMARGNRGAGRGPDAPAPREQSSSARVFDLNKGATISVVTSKGSISVEQWDQPRAEVKLLRRGSWDGIQVDSDNNHLSLDAKQLGNTEVRLEIKLPRDLGQVKFTIANGAIKASDIAGNIAIEVGNGTVTLDDVSGVESIAVGNGTIKAELMRMPEKRPMKFEVGNGNIELTFNSDFDADMEATTALGSISIDDELNIPVEKSFPAGARAAGKVGNGGEPLIVNTARGSIKINR